MVGGTCFNGMKNLKGYLVAIVSSATFGMIPLFTLPVMATGMRVSSLLFYRMFFATVTLGFCFLFFRPGSMKLTRKQLLLTVLIGGGCYVCTSSFLFLSYHYLGSGIATTIHFLYPVVVSLIMMLFFRERPSVVLFLSMFFSLAGVFLLSYSGESAIHIKGLALVLLSVLSYSTYIVSLNKTALKNCSSLPLTFYVLLSSTVLFALNAQFDGGIQPITGFYQVFNLFMLGVVCTIISNLALIVAVKNVGPTITAALGTMEPLTAVSIGVLYFSEPVSWRLLLGVAIIVAAVLLVIFSRYIPNLVRIKWLLVRVKNTLAGRSKK